jgi:hypothetical protein
MSQYSDHLTIRQAQRNQPWTVPYSEGVTLAASPENDLQRGCDDRGVGALVPHILGSHCVLHAMKSIGKIAAVYEWRDHDNAPESWQGLRAEHRAEIRKMAADLMTAALRFANLEGFDLAEALVERVKEKNGGGQMPFGLCSDFSANVAALDGRVKSEGP